MPVPTDITFFKSAAAFRRWLATHHAKRTELWVGLYKLKSGKGGLTYPEAVDQAICFGWIDGVMRSIDAESFAQRFTPRKPKSIWSNVNVAKVKKLESEGLMMPAGLAAYEARDAKRVGIYAFEQPEQMLDSAALKAFKKVPGAWESFQGLPPSYRRTVTHWVVSAKRPDTHDRRLNQLIECSARGERVPHLRPNPK